MEEKRKAKIILRPSSPLLKIVIIVLIVFSIAALVALRWVHNGILAQTEEQRQKASALKQENSELQEIIDDPGSLQSIRDIAESELGLVNPDSVVISMETEEPVE